MLAAVVNTSPGPRNVKRKTDQSGNFLANRRHRIILPVSSSLANEKETNGGETRADCAQDYSPCSCSEYVVNKIYVTCRGVAVESVRDVFQRVNDPEIYELTLYLLADDTNTVSIPKDLMGNTSVTSDIFIYSDSNDRNLVIDPFAFSSSQNSLTTFSVDGFDFGLQKDFNFLNGFNKLEGIDITNINNITAFQYLPPLPSLQVLFVTYCPEINQILFPDLSPSKLKHLFLYNNEISDEKADEIVAKLTASNSADSLEVLDLDDNSLTRIPSQVGSAFPKLKELFLGWNNISHIPSSSLNFGSPHLELLRLVVNGLKTIGSGAFRGKSTATRARKNKMKRSTGFYN